MLIVCEISRHENEGKKIFRLKQWSRYASTHAHAHAPIQQRKTGGFGRLMRLQRVSQARCSGTPSFRYCFFFILSPSRAMIGVLERSTCMCRLPHHLLPCSPIRSGLGISSGLLLFSHYFGRMGSARLSDVDLA